MSGEPTLEKGISSEWVAYLQGLMQADGFWHGEINGTFDDELEQAVQTLQGELGLSRTGIVDADMWSALEQRAQSTQQAAQADAHVHNGHKSTQPHQNGTAAETVGNPTLSSGTSSDWVAYLQAVMKHIGYWHGAEDGEFTDELVLAVRTLQRGNGLQASGVVDADTWSLLDTLSQRATSAQHNQPSEHSQLSEHSQQGRRPVSEMSATEKLIEAFNRAEISDAVRTRILAVLSPEALVTAIATFAAVFVASQFTPVGWAEDIAFGIAAVFLGSALLRAAKHLIQFAGAATATTDEELDEAGHAFAQACAELEVDALLFLIAKAAGGTGGGPSANVPASAGMVLATRDGQLVMVAVDTIPAQVATQWGITGAATGMAMSGSGDGTGGKPSSGGGGGRKLPAAPRGRVFQRGFLNFKFEATEEDWEALEAMPRAYAVYVVRNSSDKVIYIGVTERGWVRWGEHLSEKGGEWLGQASSFEFVAEGFTEKEALALEYDLIKANPRSFNTQLTYETRFGEPPGSADIPKTNVRIILELIHM